MSLLKDPPADICHSHAPNGDKSDSYFLVSNDDNVQPCDVRARSTTTAGHGIRKVGGSAFIRM